MTTNNNRTSSTMPTVSQVVELLLLEWSLNLTLWRDITSKLLSSFSWASSTTALSVARDVEKWMAFRLSCRAICSSCEDNSSWSAVVAWPPEVFARPPNLREAVEREKPDVETVSEGLTGRREGRAVLINEGEISSGSGGVMDKPLVDIPGVRFRAFSVVPESGGGLRVLSRISGEASPSIGKETFSVGRGLGMGRPARMDSRLGGLGFEDWEQLVICDIDQSNRRYTLVRQPL